MSEPTSTPSDATNRATVIAVTRPQPGVVLVRHCRQCGGREWCNQHPSEVPCLRATLGSEEADHA